MVESVPLLVGSRVYKARQGGISKPEPFLGTTGDRNISQA